MNKHIQKSEAEARFDEILRRVEAGERITITHDGRPIAEFIPSRSRRTREADKAILDILRARKSELSDNALTHLKNFGRE